MLLFLVLLASVSASSIHDIFTQKILTAPEVDAFDDITNSMLEHGVVRVKEDNSIIVSEYLLELFSLNNLEESLKYEIGFASYLTGQNRFVQTSFKNSQFISIESSWLPLSGCIDNTRCNTTTSVSRLLEVKTLNSFGPSITFSLFGMGFAMDPRISSGHVLGSKFTCDVKPGDVLQMFQREHRVVVNNVKQRRFEIESWWKRPLRLLRVNEWEPVEGKSISYWQSSSTACVTDPQKLRCEE